MAFFTDNQEGQPAHEVYLLGTDRSEGQAVIILFTSLIILFNLLMVLTIFSTPALRHSNRHILIVNTCIADLLLGMFVCPLLLDTSLKKEWTFSCHTFNTLVLLRTSLVPSVASLGIFLINVLYIMRVTSGFIDSPNKFRILTPVSLATATWLISVMVLVPLFFGATVPGSPPIISKCSRVIGNKDMALSYVILAFIPQSVLVFVSVLLMVYVHKPEYLSHNLIYYGALIQVPLDAILTTFVTLICYLPLFIMELVSVAYECTNPGDCHLLYLGIQLASWLAIAKSFIVPICWFCCKEIRHAAKCLCCG